MLLLAPSFFVRIRSRSVRVFFQLVILVRRWLAGSGVHDIAIIITVAPCGCRSVREGWWGTTAVDPSFYRVLPHNSPDRPFSGCFTALGPQIHIRTHTRLHGPCAGTNGITAHNGT